MLNFKLTSDKLNREQLLVLNTVVQGLPLEERLSYLKGLGEIYTIICNPNHYIIDERDYNVYSIVQIGEQRWLGENLRYKGVRHYENPDNPNLFYGCLYDWAAMMDIDEKYNTELWGVEIDGHHQGIAPKGWHIPSDKEWEVLGETANIINEGRKTGEDKILKSTTGWFTGEAQGTIAHGVNSEGFRAYPVGSYGYGSFDSMNSYAFFWSSLDYNDDEAFFSYIKDERNQMKYNATEKVFSGSCRCIQDK
jgi:uncharacterized protein (TIGR02145 family)